MMVVSSNISEHLTYFVNRVVVVMPTGEPSLLQMLHFSLKYSQIELVVRMTTHYWSVYGTFQQLT